MRCCLYLEYEGPYLFWSFVATKNCIIKNSNRIFVRAKLSWRLFRPAFTRLSARGMQHARDGFGVSDPSWVVWLAHHRHDTPPPLCSRRRTGKCEFSHRLFRRSLADEPRAAGVQNPRLRIYKNARFSGVSPRLFSRPLEGSSPFKCPQRGHAGVLRSRRLYCLGGCPRA